MKRILILGVAILGFLTMRSQVTERIIISTKKMGDGLYDFYATNPNYVPMQLKLWFTEFENMSASVELPYVTTIRHGEQLLFRLTRTFTDLPGGFKYKYSTRVGAYPVTPDTDHLYLLPVRKGTEVKATSFDFSNSLTPDKIIWGFEMVELDTIYASRSGVVCTTTSFQMRDSMRYGDNTVTILHTDETMAKYELFADNSLLVELGDTVSAGQPLGLVLSENTTQPMCRFTVYYVNASIDSIEENRLREFHTYLNPTFVDRSNNSFLLEGGKLYKN